MDSFVFAAVLFAALCHAGWNAAVKRGLVEGTGLLVRLGPLAPKHVQEMVAGLVRAAPGPGLLHRAELASGNPLYVRELVDALVRERAVLVAEGVAELIDPAGGTGLRSLPAAISGRLGFLTDDAVHVLRMAALLGREFSVEDLVALTGRTATDCEAPTATQSDTPCSTPAKQYSGTLSSRDAAR